MFGWPININTFLYVDDKSYMQKRKYDLIIPFFLSSSAISSHYQYPNFIEAKVFCVICKI